MSRKRHDEHKKRATGGRAEHERDNEEEEPEIENRPYNGEGSEAEQEAKDQKDGFARGGHKKKAAAKRRKRGGKADGARPRIRADRPRRARGGRPPLSSASQVQMRPGMDDAAKDDRQSD